MNKKQKMIDETKEEWRELGFYYDRYDEKKQWILTGSKSGLLQFSELLKTYAGNPHNERLSEHDHYGPYSYLKISTWTEADIGENSIRGSLADFLHLSRLVETHLASAKEGDSVVISNEYAEKCDYQIIMNVKGCDFDPTSPDPMEWGLERSDKIDEK
jgi:hypothetical protein